MVTTLDNQGKISIPREILAFLGITSETPLAIFEKGKKIIIEPVSPENPFVEKDGLLVFTGQLNGSYEQLLVNEREERDLQILKPGK